MTGPTHIALALLAAQLVYSPAEPWGWAVIALGAVAPDLDSGGGLISRPSQWLPRWAPFGGALDGAGKLASKTTRRLLGHRGPLHMPIAALALWVVAWRLGLPWLHWLAFGYAAHILADAFTKSGVPLFGPLSDRHVGLLPRRLRLRTGGGLEWLLAAVVWAYLGKSFYHVFRRW